MERTKIHNAVYTLSDELRELARAIHADPECDFQEYHACARQVALLKKHGFEVEENFCGFETAYRAVYHAVGTKVDNGSVSGADSGLASNAECAAASGLNRAPKIAFLSEYDALPGLGHACGHNLIAAVSCGSAIALKSLIDEIGGSIYLYGCPAEETSGAKAPMADAGIFDDMDVAMMAHPFSEHACGGSSMALDAIQFEYFGKASHAAAAPWEGINALDGAIGTFNMINALRQHMIPEARVHGYIKDGGKAPNIVPEYACARFYVRAPKKAYLKGLTERVINCARGAALGCGAELKVSHFESSFDDLVTNKTLAAAYRQALRDGGCDAPISDWLDGASTDTGNVSYRCPAIHAWYDITHDPAVSLHTREFEQAAGSEEAFSQSLKVCEALVVTAVRVLTEPDLLAAIRSEFDAIEK